MPIVPAAAAQLAVRAKPAGRTPCQGRHVLTAKGSAARAVLPADPTGTAARVRRAATSTDAPCPGVGARLWAERAEGLRVLHPLLLTQKLPL